MSQNILICTLGGSWAVVPEVYAFLAPDRLPLYHHHPLRDELRAAREEQRLETPAEIWIGSTHGEHVRRAVDQLLAWRALLTAPPVIRVWLAQGTDELATRQECRHVQELLLRMCLLADEKADGGQVVLSLAGGRKTMSADLQWAGRLVGCHALVHVVGKDPLPQALRMPSPETLSQPLERGVCPYLVPLVTGQGRRSELLDLELEGDDAIRPARFPLALASDNTVVVWPRPDAGWLSDELRRRERAGSRLLGNYLTRLAQDESQQNWRSLYRLSPKIIDLLRQTVIGPHLHGFLKNLPKADLHRHLGGCLDLRAQREVGRAIWDSLSRNERAVALKHVRCLVDEATWPQDWPGILGEGAVRSQRAAAVLVKADPGVLEHNLYEATQPRVALKSRHPLGFSAYERPGDLSGSALLGHPAAIEPYAQEIVRKAEQEGMAYVELRGSPQKYGNGLHFLRSFHEALNRAAAAWKSSTIFRFIIIVDRRQSQQISDVVDMAVRAKGEMEDFIAGLDLAGDEATGRPEVIAPCFLPAFRICLPLTIHAGEGEPADSIWEAAYHLHADRIGHGLTLSDHATLASRFRDRRICLELCPTSNREVIGYRDPGVSESLDCPTYPLGNLWRQGLPLTICTDNPGISRTTLVDEYLTASRMEPNGLSCWDALAILRQAFVHCFLPSRHRAQLLKDVDAQVYRTVLAHFAPTDTG